MKKKKEVKEIKAKDNPHNLHNPHSQRHSQQAQLLHVKHAKHVKAKATKAAANLFKQKLVVKPRIELTPEREIAYDFSAKVYKRFSGEIIKSIVLFGSQVKGTAVHKSDIDLVIILDDATVDWDQELIAWYREELAKLIAQQKYARKLHVNTVRLTTWWDEMLRGEPVVMNIIRYGEPLIDFGGFFTPLKVLLQRGKIKPTPEAIFIALRRSPAHMARSKTSILSAVEGLYWASVDSAHAALMSADVTPPSPEHIPFLLYETFVKKGKLKQNYLDLYRELYTLMHRILHGEVKDLKGSIIDHYFKSVDEFVGEMARLVKELEK